VPYYERSPEINKDVIVLALKALESHLDKPHVANEQLPEDNCFPF